MEEDTDETQFPGYRRERTLGTMRRNWMQKPTAATALGHLRSLLQFLVFALVGGAATAVHYTVLLLLVNSAGQAPVPASSLGAACGALVSYMLNYHVTFGTTSTHSRALPRFLVMVGIGFGLNALFMLTLVDLCEIHYIISQVATTILVLISNYAMSAHWVFTREAKE